MGNEDNLMAGLTNFGRNKVVRINENMYFSFAFGNEIALKYNESYYILNCDDKLWTQVKSKVDKYKKDVSKLKRWWFNKSKEYKISFWSNCFDDLKEE